MQIFSVNSASGQKTDVNIMFSYCDLLQINVQNRSLYAS